MSHLVQAIRQQQTVCIGDTPRLINFLGRIFCCVLMVLPLFFPCDILSQSPQICPFFLPLLRRFCGDHFLPNLSVRFFHAENIGKTSSCCSVSKKAHYLRIPSRTSVLCLVFSRSSLAACGGVRVLLFGLQVCSFSLWEPLLLVRGIFCSLFCHLRMPRTTCSKEIMHDPQRCRHRRSPDDARAQRKGSKFRESWAHQYVLAAICSAACTCEMSRHHPQGPLGVPRFAWHEREAAGMTQTAVKRKLRSTEHGVDGDFWSAFCTRTAARVPSAHCASKLRMNKTLPRSDSAIDKEPLWKRFGADTLPK